MVASLPTLNPNCENAGKIGEQRGNARKCKEMREEIGSRHDMTGQQREMKGTQRGTERDMQGTEMKTRGVPECKGNKAQGNQSARREM